MSTGYSFLLPNIKDHHHWTKAKSRSSSNFSNSPPYILLLEPP